MTPMCLKKTLETEAEKFNELPQSRIPGEWEG